MSNPLMEKMLDLLEFEVFLLDVQQAENCNLTNKENDTQNAPNKEFITLTVPAEDEELYRRALKERELIKRKKSSSSTSTNCNIQENSL